MKTKYFYAVLFSFLLTSFVSHAQPGIFLYYPDVTNGKGPKGHVDETEIIAFAQGFSKANGQSAAFTGYSITKYMDATTPAIQTRLTNGTSTDGVELRIYNNVGAIIHRIQLKGVNVTSYSTGGNRGELAFSCPNCTGLTENITFDFTAVKIGDFQWDIPFGTSTF